MLEVLVFGSRQVAQPTCEFQELRCASDVLAIEDRAAVVVTAGSKLRSRSHRDPEPG